MRPRCRPTNPNGVLHVDTTSAHAGETATITVTATDPTDKTTVTRSFVVTVSAYNGPTNPVINFVPFANPVSSTAQFNAPVAVQLSGQGGFPDASPPPTLSYKLLSQPAHGIISNFNASSGTLTYTPDANYSGPDTFQYEVLSTGPGSTPATTTSVPATVALTVASAPPINSVPIANPVSSTAQFNTPVAVQLSGQSGVPNPSPPPTLSYKLLSQPAHGTISNFSASSGTLTYTPDANYSGPDAFQYEVLSTVPGSTPATTTSVPATVTLTVASAPLVTVTGVGDVTTKRHLVTQISVQFSNAVNADQSDMTSIYRLALPGKHGSYTARNARVIKLRKAVYDASSKTVALTLRTPLALTRKKLQLLINGSEPSGLTDNFGRLIDGDHNGTPGGNGIAYLSKSGVTVSSFRR